MFNTSGDFGTGESESPVSPDRFGISRMVIAALALLLVLGIFLILSNDSGMGLFNPARPVANQNIRPATGMVSVSRYEPTPTLVSTLVQGEALALQQVLVNIYQRVDPSVVNIEVTTGTGSSSTTDSSGSGFVVDTSGHIVTNAHVIQDAQAITVTFRDGYSTGAKIVGADDYSDIAVIKVTTDIKRLIPVTFGDSDALLVGQSVIAIGNPFGLLSSMTQGIVSATGRTLNSAMMLRPRSGQTFQNPAIIQFDAVINPGNSGGPLLNLNGEVIGINTAIRSETGSFQGIGFAVPSNTIKRVYPQLIKTGQAEYTWLGIEGISPQRSGIPGLTMATLSELYKLPIDYGVLISNVVKDSPADAAGLRGGSRAETFRGVPITLGGDIIVAINKVPVRDFDALTGYLVTNTEPGQVVTVTIYRGDQVLDVDVTLAVRPN